MAKLVLEALVEPQRKVPLLSIERYVMKKLLLLALGLIFAGARVNANRPLYALNRDLARATLAKASFERPDCVEALRLSVQHPIPHTLRPSYECTTWYSFQNLEVEGYLLGLGLIERIERKSLRHNTGLSDSPYLWHTFTIPEQVVVAIQDL